MHTPAPIPDLQKIVSTLLELTGTSIAELARQTGLHRPNLVSWLGGKEHVLALLKQLKACEALGWRDGRLLRTRIHRWWIGNHPDALNTALRLLEPHDTRFGLIPMRGGDAEHGGILVSLSPDSKPPLTILLARPPSPSVNLPLSKMLSSDIRVCTTSVSMSPIDWSIWWDDTENHDVPLLLKTTAKHAWAMLQNVDQPPHPSAKHEDIQNRDETEWLELMRRARAAGVDIEGLISKFNDWIAKK